MVRLVKRFDAPIEPRAKVVLQMYRPTRECVVAIGRAVPRVHLIRPIVRLACRILARTVTAGPTAPGWLVWIIHTRRHKIEERHGVTFLLPMRGVGGVKSAQRTMPCEDIAL